MPGIHHVSVGVTDVARAKAFYDPLMRILGLQLKKVDEESVDYGNEVGIVFSFRFRFGWQQDRSGHQLSVMYSF